METTNFDSECDHECETGHDVQHFGNVTVTRFTCDECSTFTSESVEHWAHGSRGVVVPFRESVRVQ